MASDYGDEAGEKLFDWMLRMGQDASQDAIRAERREAQKAIRNLRGQIDEPLAEAEHESVRDYARLNLSEFEELPTTQACARSSMPGSTLPRLSTTSRASMGTTTSYSRWKTRRRWTRLSRSSNATPTRHAREQ